MNIRFTTTPGPAGQEIEMKDLVISDLGIKGAIVRRFKTTLWVEIDHPVMGSVVLKGQPIESWKSRGKA